MRRLILAAAFAAASASFAYGPAFANTSPNPAGVDDLGIDISSVRLDPAAVHGFLASLSPESRRDVEAACAMYDRTPAGAGEQTLAFCADARA